MQNVRIESDSLGEMEIPESAYYGIQTMRGMENSTISGQKMDAFPEFIYAIAVIKKAAAIANYKADALSKEFCDAICQAAEEVMDNKFQGQFPIDIIQGGGGVSSHMNINEVIASRANEILTGEKTYSKIHPNTHVNMGQSTNDVIPSAMKIASSIYLEKLIKSVEQVEEAFLLKQEEFKNVVKLGRTCIQDALPLTLGQEFSGYASVTTRRKNILIDLKEKCIKLPLGATAIGTKIGTNKNYSENVYKEISKILGYTVKQDENLFDGLQNADTYVDLSAGLKGLALSMSKIAADLRLLSSGPKLGLQEINLPAVQAGSSIMPGKYNPTIPELVIQACYITCGNDTAICMSAEAGELDLNVWEPVIIKSIAESSRLLTGSLKHFAEKCILGITANKEYCHTNSSNSLALAAVIATLIDYPTGGMVAKKAQEQECSIREFCIKEEILSKEQADILLDPLLLTDGDLFAKKIEEYRDIVRKNYISKKIS